MQQTELGDWLTRWGIPIQQPRYVSHFEEESLHRYIGEYVVFPQGVLIGQAAVLTFERDGEYIIAQFDVALPWVLQENI